MMEGKSDSRQTIRFRLGVGCRQSSATAVAVVTFACMLTEPAGAPMIAAILSPISRLISHQRSSHARTPRVAQVRAYSASESAAAAGIAPSELLIMYTVSARIG